MSFYPVCMLDLRLGPDPVADIEWYNPSPCLTRTEGTVHNIRATQCFINRKKKGLHIFF